MRRALFVLAAAALLPGCDDDLLPRIDLERMIDQAKAKPYGESEFFADGRAMRRPPEDSVPVTRRETDPGLAVGEVAGAYLTRPSIPVTRPLLTIGRNRFETYCAACHGIRGDGDSVVAFHMNLRRPPSLIDPRVQSFPDGRIYQVIVLGYGLMRPYTEDLTTPEERWATVAYLRALQLSQAKGVPLESLPPAERRRAEEELH
jgi:mono/diheme cytochrome c family protein